MRWPHRLKIVIPGRIKFSFVREGVGFYQQRLEHYLDFRILERKLPGKVCGRPERIKALEAETLLAPVPQRAFVVALDERGKEYSSLELAQKMEEIFNREKESYFLLGGAFGLDEKVRQRANLILSLSRLTLAHELALLILCEQLYRTVTILSGESYHK